MLHLTASNAHLFFSGDKQLDGYQKKKYVCKLLFIFLLGHDIDFGHMEAVNLLSSNKYTEKQIVSIPWLRKCILIHSIPMTTIKRMFAPQTRWKESNLNMETAR